MNKTKLLNDLFLEWQKAEPENIKKDGINNEKLYEKAVKKILFIMKEPNNPHKDTGDYRNWWKETIKYIFSIRIGEWSYGILNEFPEYTTFYKSRELKHSAILQIAFMNVKKVGGKGTSNLNTILQYVQKNLYLIKKEIKIIDPQIVILGLSFSGKLRDMIFSEAKWKYGKGIRFTRFENMRIIDFYHPSARNKTSEELYYLLRDIIQSEEFNNL